MLALAFESSCDETAVALVQRDRRILSSRVYSQIKLHEVYGGVVPEVAARAHLAKIDTLVEAALDEAKVTLDEVDLIASTAGPGLIGGLLVGVTYGRMLAKARGLPWYGINHLEGHALTARLTHDVAYPYLLLLISGGHTQLVWVEALGQYRRLGTTLDDAAGECFDKSAKMLGLGYPGGREIEIAARAGNPKAVELPIPLIGQDHCNFSFSGLKTAVRHRVQAFDSLTPQIVADIAASTQRAIATSLADRTRRALKQVMAQKPSALVVAGGVAANSAVRDALTLVAAEFGLALVAPPLAYCGDNAAMIAWAALERHISGLGAEDAGQARPRWPLDPTQGSGKGKQK